MTRGDTLALSAVVRDAVGRNITGTADPVTWSLADTSVAVVAGSTLTGAGLSGYTTLHAVSGPRSGSARILVGTPFTRIVAGAYHTCGLDPTRQAYCWGLALFGLLGDGRTSGHTSEPGAVHQGSSRFVDITGGQYHTCALSAEGQAYSGAAIPTACSATAR